MATITCVALFTASGGAPATGLTLTDIDFYLYSISINDGTISAVWNTQNPTAEVSNTGMYIRQYASADLTNYAYVARANYTGGSTLDSDNVYIAFARAEVNPASTVTITNPLAADGQELSIVWGDDYNSTESREISWSSTGWPDLTGGTVAFNYWNPKVPSDRGSFAMSLGSVGGATQDVDLQLTSAQTKTLGKGKRRYRYEVEATLSTRAVTLVSSDSAWLTVGDSYD